MAYPGIITVDDQEIRYRSLSIQISVPFDSSQQPLLAVYLSGPTMIVYGVDGVDTEGKPFSFLCRQAWPNDGTYPSQFYTLGEDRVRMVKKVVATARPAPSKEDANHVQPVAGTLPDYLKRLYNDLEIAFHLTAHDTLSDEFQLVAQLQDVFEKFTRKQE